MSIVKYVVYGSSRQLDGSAWREIADSLKQDGYDLRFREDDRASWQQARSGICPPDKAKSLSLASGPMSGQAEILLNFETRESNEALEAQYWSAPIKDLLAARPKSLFLQVCYTDDESFDFWHDFATSAAEILDGVIYDESAGEIMGRNGEMYAMLGEGDDGSAPDCVDDDEAAAQDEEPTITGMGTCVIECRRPFTPTELANVAQEVSAHIELLQIGQIPAADKAFADAADSQRWKRIVLWDPVESGLMLDVERTEKRGSPFYARASMDICDDLFERDAETEMEIARRVRELLRRLGERFDVALIDFESN